VELLTGEQKAIKESNLEVSLDIDQEFEVARAKHLIQQLKVGAETGAKPQPREERRPLGEAIVWPKVKGIHPGAMVRLQGLTGAPELNGRRGRCLTFDAEVGRWKVDLGDEQKALRVENLTPAPGERPPTKVSAEEDKKALVAKGARAATLSPKEAYAESYGWDG